MTVATSPAGDSVGATTRSVPVEVTPATRTPERLAPIERRS